MLRVGLSGGIGSGKSSVARRLVELGAVLIDSDVLAREVLAPGSDGLTQVVDTFGPEVLDADGGLDRAALAAIVFADAGARGRLNAIVHPRVRRRSDELIAAAPADAVVVQDVPLLVEGGMAALFALVVIVHADAEERVRRLVTARGMAENDAWSRIAAQADDGARRAVADVWLDNSGAPDELAAAVDALWHDRLVGFAENLRRGLPAPAGAPRFVDHDPGWAAQAARLVARVERAAGSGMVAHVGSTAVPGLPTEDVVDLQLGVDSLALAPTDALRAVGFPRWGGRADTATGSPEQLHGSADPGRAVRLHVREVGSPAWRFALLFRDWLRADPGARVEYLAVERSAEERTTPGSARYVEVTQPWIESVRPRADAWAASCGWVPSLS